MATLIGKPVGKVINKVSDLQDHRVFQSPVTKAWRALILAHRAGSPMNKVLKESKDLDRLSKEQNEHIAGKTFSKAQESSEWYQHRIQATKPTGELDQVKARKDLEDKKEDFTLSNQQTLEDIIKNKIRNDIVIANLQSSPAVSIVIQNRPDSLTVEPTSTWATVRSMGRNNPFYYYTGGEDTISFDISWYANDPEHRDEVINKCRLLESWTRADGYSTAPPNLRIQWGASGLFEDDLFILYSASYKLTHFQNAVRFPTRLAHDKYGTRVEATPAPVNLGLYPNYATQTLVFKRVSTKNRTWEDIIPSSKLEYTKGIIL